MNMPARQTCTTATVSLIFGILSWFVLPILGALIAIVAGYMARSEMRRSQGTLDGEGLATAGIVLGYLHLAVILFFVLVVFLFFGGLAFFIALAAHAGHG